MRKGKSGTRKGVIPQVENIKKRRFEICGNNNKPKKRFHSVKLEMNR